MIRGVTEAGAIPSLETAIRFAARRQGLIAHNIANISTPDFRPLDVSVRGFQGALGEAIDRRRRESGGMSGPLEIKSGGEIRHDERGNLRLEPRTPMRNVLFHDRNNRDVERLMQSLAENAGAFRVATELLRSHKQTITSAIRETP